MANSTYTVIFLMFSLTQEGDRAKREGKEPPNKLPLECMEIQVI